MLLKQKPLIFECGGHAVESDRDAYDNAMTINQLL